MIVQTISSRAIGLITACLAIPIAALAQQPSVELSTSTAKVWLAGLDLTTAQGIAAARNRLHETARENCSQAVDNRYSSDRANFLSCVDNTLISELKQINSGTRDAIVAHGSTWPTATEIRAVRQLHESAQDTSVMAVSIADLDLSSAQDVLIAQRRIHTTARRICGQLTSSQDSASIYAKCVNDAAAGALRQINAAAVTAN